jgi:cell division protein FtsI/penicillin-binding protein 2
MKLSRWLTLAITLILLAACNGNGTTVSGTTPTSTLPTPEVVVTRAPDAESALRTFLDSYVGKDFTTMYGLITDANRIAITVDDFTKLYQNSVYYLSVQKIEYTITSIQINPGTASAAYHLVYHTFLFGDIARDFSVSLVQENDGWHLQWENGLILPEMSGGKHIVTNYDVPARGSIYDRNGNPIVAETEAVALGVIPQEIIIDQEGSLMYDLWQLTGLRPDTIRAIYQSYPWNQYVPIGETTKTEFGGYYSALSELQGWYATDYTARYYMDGGIASQTIGYLRKIGPEDFQNYRSRGYGGDEMVGDAGIEAWGEDILHGKNGATLFLISTDGKVIQPPMATSDQQPASDITLTIDKDLQEQAQAAMDGMAGAIVVLERDTGRVLALVSSPGYDPNLFVPDNYNNMAVLSIGSDGTQPLFNRATQGKYPLGSVFKVVTTAAALESGAYTKDSTIDCQYDFNGLVPLGGPVLHDWTYDHCQQQILADPTLTLDTCGSRPSGVLTLSQGLMRSCNPWFWTIGLNLYQAGMGINISNMARGFGLGSTTGIQTEENAGNIPDPTDAIQATNIAIGQGDVQVTPLQVADFIAAVGNGGMLYRPQIVEKITAADGTVTFSFQPELRGINNGKLPISQANLTTIQDALHEVVKNRRGTAYIRLNSLQYAVSGKTGTAESGIPGYPHAWFAGYTMENRADKPDIAIAVFVQNKGEGSDYAAPIFRRIVEIYFSGQPQTPYWFEESIGVTETPTPGPGTPSATP